MIKTNIYDPEFTIKYPGYNRALKETTKPPTVSKSSKISLLAVKSVIQILAKEKTIPKDHVDTDRTYHKDISQTVSCDGEDSTQMAVYQLITQTILSLPDREELIGDLIYFLTNETGEKSMGEDNSTLRAFVCSCIRKISSLPVNIDTFTINKSFFKTIGAASIGQRTLCNAYIKTQNFGRFFKMASSQNTTVLDWSVLATNSDHFWQELTYSIRKHIIGLKLSQLIGQSDLSQISNLLDSCEYVYSLFKNTSSDHKQDAYKDFMEILCLFVPKLLALLPPYIDEANFGDFLSLILARALIFLFKFNAAFGEHLKLSENSTISTLVEVLSNWLILHGVKEQYELHKEAVYNLPFVLYRCVKIIHRDIIQPKLERNSDSEWLIYKDLYRDYLIQFGTYAYSLSFKDFNDISKDHIENLYVWGMVKTEWAKVFDENGYNVSSQDLTQFEEEFVATFLSSLKVPVCETVLQEGCILKLFTRINDSSHSFASVPPKEMISMIRDQFEMLSKSLFAHHSFFLETMNEICSDENQTPNKAYLVVSISRLINLLMLNSQVLQGQLERILTSIPLKYMEDFIPILLSIYKMTPYDSAKNLAFVALQRFCQDPSYSVLLIYSILPDLLNFEDSKDQALNYASKPFTNDTIKRIQKLYHLLEHGNNTRVGIIKSFVSALRYFALPLEQAWINGLQMYQNDFKRRHSHLVKALENRASKKLSAEKSVKKLSFKADERVMAKGDKAHKFPGLEEIMIEHIRPIQRILTYMVDLSKLRSDQASTYEWDLEFGNQFNAKLAEIQAEFESLFLKIGKFKDKDLESDVLNNILACLDSPFSRLSSLYADILEKYQGRKNSKMLLENVCPDLLSVVNDSKVHGGIPLITRDEQNDIQIINVVDIDPVVIVLQTKTKPKKLTFTVDDGSRHEYLLKAHEDLQLDHKVLQFNLMSDRLFSSLFDNHSRSLIKCYQVIPLSHRAGLIQMIRGTGKHILPLYGLYKTWLLSNAPPALQSVRVPEETVPHTGSEHLSNPSLPDVGSDYNRNFPAFESTNNTGPTTPLVVGAKFRKADAIVARQPIELYYEKLQPALLEAGLLNRDAGGASSPAPASTKQAANALTADRSSWPPHLLGSVYQELLSQTPAEGYLLWNELTSRESSSDAIGHTFALTTALNSVVGYLLGLGDRHLGNLLVDFRTGSLIHIDFNVCFERGKYLKVPENVPFRMTPIIEMALGPLNGVDGTFRETVYNGMRALRRNPEIFRAYSSWLLLDPAPEWCQNSGIGKFGHDSSPPGRIDKENALLDTLARYFLPTVPDQGSKIQLCNAAYWLSELRDNTTEAYNYLIGKHAHKWQLNKMKILETLDNLMANLKEHDIISVIKAKHAQQLAVNSLPVETNFGASWKEWITKCLQFQEKLENYKKALKSMSLDFLQNLEEQLLGMDHMKESDSIIYSRQLLIYLKRLLPTYTFYFERLTSSNWLFKLSQIMVEGPGEDLSDQRIEKIGNLLKHTENPNESNLSTLAPYITRIRRDCAELLRFNYGQNSKLDSMVLEIAAVIRMLDKLIALRNDIKLKIQPQINGIKQPSETEDLFLFCVGFQEFVVNFSTKILSDVLVHFLRCPMATADAFRPLFTEIFAQKFNMNCNFSSVKHSTENGIEMDKIYAYFKACLNHFIETNYQDPSLQTIASMLQNFEHFDEKLEVLQNSVLKMRGSKETTISTMNTWLSDKKSLYVLRLCMIKTLLEDLSQSINDELCIDIIKIHEKLLNIYFLPYCRMYIKFLLYPIGKILAAEHGVVNGNPDGRLACFDNAGTEIYGPDIFPACQDLRTKTIAEDLSKSLAVILVEYSNFVMCREGICVNFDIDWANKTLVTSNEANLNSLRLLMKQIKGEINWKNSDILPLINHEKNPEKIMDFLVYLSQVLMNIETIKISCSEFETEIRQFFPESKEIFVKAKAEPDKMLSYNHNRDDTTLRTSKDLINLKLKGNELSSNKAIYKDIMSERLNGGGVLDYLEKLTMALRQTLVDLQNYIFSQNQIVNNLNHCFKQLNKLKMRLVELGESCSYSTVLEIVGLLDKWVLIYGVCIDFYKDNFTSPHSDCSVLMDQLKQAAIFIKTCKGPWNQKHGRSPERVKVEPKSRRKRNQSCDSKPDKLNKNVEEGTKKIILARKSVLSNTVPEQMDNANTGDDNQFAILNSSSDPLEFLFVHYPLAKIKITKMAKMLREALSLLYEILPDAITFLQFASYPSDKPEDSASLEQKAIIISWCNTRHHLLNQLDLIGDKGKIISCDAKNFEIRKTDFEGKRRVAKHIVARMGDKLNGNDEDLLPYLSSHNSLEKDSAFPMSIEKQVDALIIQSKAKHNLATIYEGWMAWI